MIERGISMDQQIILKQSKTSVQVGMPVVTYTPEIGMSQDSHIILLCKGLKVFFVAYDLRVPAHPGCRLDETHETPRDWTTSP